MTIVSLDDLFFYQNVKTGQASSTAVSVRQLCKILATGTTHVTADTLVFSNTNEWIPLKTISILKEASSKWYYTTTTIGGGASERKGPVGVKQLQQQQQDDDGIIQMVYSASFADKGWFKINDSPDLMQAMKAFEAAPLPPPEEPQLLPDAKDEEPVVVEEKDDVQKELEAFLQSTESSGAKETVQNQVVEEEESYQSDGGTTYVKDHSSGRWIHEALAPKPIVSDEVSPPKTNNKRPPVDETKDTVASGNPPPGIQPTKKKRKRANKFTARNAKCWIYISGLPLDTTEEEVGQVFGKVGILDLDSDAKKPKVKLYYEKAKDGERVLKGDGSVCFARPESVDLAIQLFDQAPFRLEDPRKTVIRVERAKFEQRGESYQTKHTSWQKRQVAKKAALQAVGWDEGQNGRITGGMKGLTIVVLKHMFTEEQANDDKFLEEMEKNLRRECSELGTVEKITVFTSNPEGIVVIRFKEPTAATAAIAQFNGRVVGDTKLEAHFWDGVTNYIVLDHEKEKVAEDERHEEFGEWLESHEELPEEFRLQVES